MPTRQITSFDHIFDKDLQLFDKDLQLFDEDLRLFDEDLQLARGLELTNVPVDS